MGFSEILKTTEININKKWLEDIQTILKERFEAGDHSKISYKNETWKILRIFAEKKGYCKVSDYSFQKLKSFAHGDLLGKSIKEIAIIPLTE